MEEHEGPARAFALPLTNPAYPPWPYRFAKREFLIITYRTDAEKLRAILSELLEIETLLIPSR
jgi:acetoacetate decarboxylase